ncbi:MAG: prolyl oligopeptidase family serine peptidase [Chitinophagaceae bacterium]
MRKGFLSIVSSILFFALYSQQISKQDYERAVSFRMTKLNNKKVFNLFVNPNWNADSTGFSYVTQQKNNKQFNKIDFAKMQVEPLADQERLAKQLSGLLKTTVNAADLPVTNMRYKDKNHLALTAGGKNYTLNLADYSLEPAKEESENEMEAKSPDGEWIAYTDKYNLFIKSTKTAEIKQLSKEGRKNYEYASYYGWGDIMEGENGEREKHFNVQWSPDSKWIQTYICDLTKGQKMYLLDWSVDTLYRARLLSYYRGSPGDTDMVYMTPVLFNVETGEEIRRDEFRNVNDATLEWSKEPGLIYIENRKRGYQQVDLYLYDVNGKKQELLYSEKSATSIDNYSSEVVIEWGQIIITSEKDGWKQLYLLDIKSKKLSPLTNGSYYVNGVLNINKKTKTILFTAAGKEPGRNPYFQQLYRINTEDHKDAVLLTPENANHDVSVSPNGKYFVDNISTLDMPTRTVLRETATGKIIRELSKANIEELLAMNFHYPEAFTATGRDGITTIYGAIWKPSNFNAAKKYPIIDQSYTGPHTNMFPRSFAAAIGRNNQALAELGFIVVTVDGLGTAGRSKAFHNVSYKNMGKNLTDHVLAMKELGKRYTWIDTTRVGIFGHSAGGYDAGHAVLEFPDFYKVAVASSADHDFRMEKDWWPEMYMGWPVDSTYNQVSNITMAGNLKGKLLIVHGGIDENVNPSATFKLAEALVKADKEFDMLILPSQHHGYQGKFADYFVKKLWNYFVEHLLGAKPIWEFQLN